ncbi:hypothetical protein EC957_006944 [Mortierella hygrophila]|uniref:Hikeshi-like domain-containing protein n=1 Tax=Mortierella hygrophila TaxID=979708 RepID=A0A9P6EXL7_9FUNG|nr:hypothetical protein EC957_006944 [Mortierella hygrophila]
MSVQTNLQQVDVNKFTFQLDDAEAINHIVVFLLGTIPFQHGSAATVHLLWPNKTWQLLGMLSNEKASAIFRLKANGSKSTAQQSTTGASISDMSIDSSSSTTTSPTTAPITATLGISIEPINVVMSQIATLASSSSSTSTVPSNALVPLSSINNNNTASPDSVAAIAQKVMSHLYNHVTSFATAVVPQGSTVLVPTGGPGSAMSVLANQADMSFLPVRAFNDWFQNVVRKAKSDPMFLTRE